MLFSAILKTRQNCRQYCRLLWKRNECRARRIKRKNEKERTIEIVMKGMRAWVKTVLFRFCILLSFSIVRFLSLSFSLSTDVYGKYAWWHKLDVCVYMIVLHRTTQKPAYGAFMVDLVVRANDMFYLCCLQRIVDNFTSTWGRCFVGDCITWQG